MLTRKIAGLFVACLSAFVYMTQSARTEEELQGYRVYKSSAMLGCSTDDENQSRIAGIILEFRSAVWQDGDALQYEIVWWLEGDTEFEFPFDLYVMGYGIRGDDENNFFLFRGVLNSEPNFTIGFADAEGNSTVNVSARLEISAPWVCPEGIVSAGIVSLLLPLWSPE